MGYADSLTPFMIIFVVGSKRCGPTINNLNLPVFI